jgi:hypothetical protein
MSRPEVGRPSLSMETWLARKIKLGNLRSLPPFYANGGAIIHLPEPYARLLLTALREPSSDQRNQEQIRDDARAFRSWVEGNQLDLTPAVPKTVTARVGARA